MTASPVAAATVQFNPETRLFIDGRLRDSSTVAGVTREEINIDPRLAMGRVVVAHLGNGASLCAISAGRSVATTMTFSPLSRVLVTGMVTGI